MPIYVGFVREIRQDGSPIYPDQGLPGNQPYPDNSLPGNQPYPGQGLPPFPSHPIVLPPLPPDLKPDNSLPQPQPHPEHPIFIPITPEHPIELPPGEVWPPVCNCDSGISGPGLLLVNIIGVGYRWLHYEAEVTYPPKKQAK